MSDEQYQSLSECTSDGVYPNAKAMPTDEFMRFLIAEREYVVALERGPDRYSSLRGGVSGWLFIN